MILSLDHVDSDSKIRIHDPEYLSIGFPLVKIRFELQLPFCFTEISHKKYRIYINFSILQQKLAFYWKKLVVNCYF